MDDLVENGDLDVWQSTQSTMVEIRRALVEISRAHLAMSDRLDERLDKMMLDVRDCMLICESEIEVLLFQEIGVPIQGPVTIDRDAVLAALKEEEPIQGEVL